MPCVKDCIARRMCVDTCTNPLVHYCKLFTLLAPSVPAVVAFAVSNLSLRAIDPAVTLSRWSPGFAKGARPSFVFAGDRLVFDLNRKGCL